MKKKYHFWSERDFPCRPTDSRPFFNSSGCLEGTNLTYLTWSFGLDVFFPGVHYYTSFFPMWWAVDQFFRETQRFVFFVLGEVLGH